MQHRFAGAVVVRLDVNGSMVGNPLAQAVVDCERFIDEAFEAHYEGVMLFWHHDVGGNTGLSRDRCKFVCFSAP